MKIYISGKISGLDYDDAFDSFSEAEDWVLIHGHEAVNPMKKVSEQQGFTWEQYMLEDIAILFACDGIFMLRNWQDSKGARIERAICEVLGKAIFYQESNLEITAEDKLCQI
ncbi:MAG: DUF4406 domain-containing protein [Hyphomonadaceae bacterium]